MTDDRAREELARHLFGKWREVMPGSLTFETFGEHHLTPFYEQADTFLAWQAAQPVVVSEEQVEAAAIAMTEPSLWDDPWWHPTFHGDTRSPEERREHFRNGVREKVHAALAALGITVEPTPSRTFVQAPDDEPGDDLPGSWTPTVEPTRNEEL